MIQQLKALLCLLAESLCSLLVHLRIVAEVFVSQVSSFDGQRHGIGGAPSQVLLFRLTLPASQDVDEVHHALIPDHREQVGQRALSFLDHIMEERDGDGTVVTRRPNPVGYPPSVLDLEPSELGAKVAE